MENKRITITSMVNWNVVINIPELRLNRIWERKGVKKTIPFDVLAEAIYDPSVEYLFKEGMLYIDDIDVKIELGLEEPAAKENKEMLKIQPMRDEEIHRLLTVVPIYEFKDRVRALNREQVKMVIDYAIKNEITDFEKSNFLKELTQVDIIKTVQLNHEDKGE